MWFYAICLVSVLMVYTCSWNGTSTLSFVWSEYGVMFPVRDKRSGQHRAKAVILSILAIYTDHFSCTLESGVWLIHKSGQSEEQNASGGLPWWRSGWESACQCRGHGFEPWSGKIPHAAERLGPWATITEPVHLEPVLRNKRGCDSERPVHRDEEWPPLATTRGSPHTETKIQHSHKYIKKNKLKKKASGFHLCHSDGHNLGQHLIWTLFWNTQKSVINHKFKA